MSSRHARYDDVSAEAIEARALLARFDWRASFDRSALGKAAQMHELALASIERLTESRRGECYELRGQVESQGGLNRYYRVEVRVRMSARGIKVDGECACPVGFQCKHAAALVMELLEPEQAGVETPAAGGRPDADARLAMQQQLMAQAAAQGVDLQTLFPGLGTPSLDARAQRNLDDWSTWLRRLHAAPKAEAVHALRLRYELSVAGQQLHLQVLAAVSDSALYTPITQNWSVGNGDPWRGVPEDECATLQAVLGQRRVDVHSQARLLIGAQGERTLAAVLERDCRIAERALRLADARDARLTWLAQAGGSQKLGVDAGEGVAVVLLAGLWYVDTQAGQIGPVRGVDATLFKRVCSAPSLQEHARRVLLQNRAAWPAELPVPVAIERIDLTEPCAAQLRLRRLKKALVVKGADSEYVAGLHHRYGEHWVDADESRMQFEFSTGGRHVAVHRDRSAETAIATRLPALGITLRMETYPHYRSCWGPWDTGLRGEDWLLLAGRLREAGFELDFGADFPLSLEAPPDQWYAELEEAGSNAWFDLELGIRIGDEKVSLLPILVRALASKSFPLQAAPGEAPDATWLAPIDDRRRVPLPLTRVRALLAPIIEWLEGSQGERLRLPALRADLADAWEGLDFEVRAAATLRKLAVALRSPAPGEAPLPPAGLRTELREYQRAGLGWLEFLGRHGLGGVLADDMGLGKTVQVLAHLLAERESGRLRGPVLVVMPTSLIPNWQAEATRFAPDLRVLTLHGGDRAERYAQAAQADLVLTSYALLVRDCAHLESIAFDLAVFDEAQALKNSASKGAHCARRLKATRRLLLTGTPLENHLGELWAGVDLVLPGLLGERRAFASHFRTPIEKRADRERLAILNRRLKPFLLRRTKQQVASELPPKTEIVQRIELEGAQRELYETLRLAMHKRVREAIARRGVAQSGIVVLDALLRLRQACCDPALVKLASARRARASAKREALLELLDPLLAEGRKVLLFSQFTEMLDLIEGDLRARQLEWTRLDGSTRDRAYPVAEFQAGRVPLMLISLKAGGVGLNLTAADTVIHYDPWWNPAVEQQATDRAHRIGQDKPVFVYKLVCVDTVEDKIVALQARKAELAASILDGGASTSLRFDEETIEELLGRP